MEHAYERSPRGRSFGPTAAARADEIRRAISRARRWSVVLLVIFAGLAVAVAQGATAAADQKIAQLADRFAQPALDIAASLITILGQLELTGLIALILSFVWWRRRGARGLVPLLLFLGMAIEAVLKHVIPHHSPPELSRNIEFLPFLHSHSPFSFPSGHVFRTTFIAALMVNHWVFWPLVLIMAVTRVYLNEHWLSDAFGGLLLGLALAGIAAAIYGGPVPDDRR